MPDEIQKLKKQINKNIKTLEERLLDLSEGYSELTDLESNLQIQKNRLAEIIKYKKQ